MELLDDINKIKKIDLSNSYDSIKSFNNQLKQIWQEVSLLNLSPELNDIENIVLSGMGGSTLGGRTIQTLFEDQIKFPFQVVTEYNLPKYLSPQSLLIITSYSGNTEETLSCLNQGLNYKSKIFAFSTNGKIGELISQKKISGHIFQPIHNPLGYPKTAIGYSIGSLLALFSKLKFIDVDNSEFGNNLNEFIKIQENYFLENPLSNNPAKKLATNLKNKLPVIIASEHLKGAAYCLKNEINELAHQYCIFFDLPEMNHHLVEAFAKPISLKDKLVYLFFNSSFYHPQNQKRYLITRQILNKLGIDSFNFTLKSSTKLSQALEVVNLGGFLAFYLSVLDHEDPGPEPWILYLKKLLQK